MDHWADANQRYLMAQLGLVRQSVMRHIAARGDFGEFKAEETVRLEAALNEAAGALSGPSALDSLCAAFGLSPFERDILLLSAGIELDSAFARLCASAQGNPQRSFPTFSLALAALREPHWSAVTPEGPLRRWRLIELGHGESLTTSPLRVDERVLHYLAGLPHLDGRLQGLIEPVLPTLELPPSQREVARRIADVWTR